MTLIATRINNEMYNIMKSDMKKRKITNNSEYIKKAIMSYAGYEIVIRKIE